MKRVPLLLLLIGATALWLPSLHLFYALPPSQRDELGRKLASRHAALVSTADVSSMRRVNPEWDFMRRTYTVLALANRALAHPEERAQNLAAIDVIVDATIGETKTLGDDHFMLAYAKGGTFVDTSARSMFIDGEIVTMIAARELVEPRAATRPEAVHRAALIEGAMRRSPSLSGESYPNECWTFCNTTALAGLAMLDRAIGADHRALAHEWVSHAKAHLVDPATGLLVSSYTYDGRPLDGPEGSSIWMSAQNLLFVDDEFARDQYARARRELRGSVLGFGFAREWPRGTPPRPDVDSGLIVPLLEASPGASGLAVVAASAFGDDLWERELWASIELTGFRDEVSGRYRASNDVGDAVLLYSLSFGPLLARTRTNDAVSMLTPDVRGMQ